jgi:hypothetical protein
VASSSDTNKPESNKFNAHFRTQVTSLPPAEVEDVFLPAPLAPAIEAFSAGLSPEYFVANLLLHFMGLARANSCVEGWISQWDDFLQHPHFPKVFLGARTYIALANLRFRMMGLGRGWQRTPANSKMRLSYPCRNP